MSGGLSPSQRERNIRITKNVLAGESYREAGGREGVSPERARQIFNKMMMFTRHRLYKEMGQSSNHGCLQDFRRTPDFWAHFVDYFYGEKLR